MKTIARLLKIVNDSYWVNHEKCFQITPASVYQHRFDMKQHHSGADAPLVVLAIRL